MRKRANSCSPEPKKIGKYPLIRRLGKGITEQSDELVQRFIQEARSAARINHARVARIYDAGSDDETNYIVWSM